MRYRFIFIFFLFFFINQISFSDSIKKDEKKDLKNINLFHEVPIFNDDGSVNAVIEVPSGENQKWMVSKKTGKLKWEKKNNSFRYIKYLGYPVNYGIIPQTITPKGDGGDGDPIDILVIGEKFTKGSVVKVKIIGVMKMLDNGEVDDKLLGIFIDSKIINVNLLSDINDLKNNYPGMLEIFKIWFENYKGTGQVIVKNFENKIEALKIIEKSKEPYEVLKGYWKNNN